LTTLIALVVAGFLSTNLLAAMLLGGITTALFVIWSKSRRWRANWPGVASIAFSTLFLGATCLFGLTTVYGGLATLGVIQPTPSPQSSVANARASAASPSLVTATATPTPATPRATMSPTPSPTAVLGRAPTGPITYATVVRVVDGDTIRVEIDGKEYPVRYIGIDTPETVDPRKPVQWMGPEASAANERLVDGQQVVLEKDVSEVDRYDRLLRYIWLEQPTGWLLVNLELVRTGYAHSSSYPPDVKYQDLFRQAEAQAREAELGLWSETPSPSPTASPTPERTAAPTPKPTAASTPKPAPTASARQTPAPTVAPTPKPALVSVCGGNMDAPGNDNYAENLNGEYVVICNAGGKRADLTGWRVQDQGPNFTYTFPSFSLAAGAKVTLFSGSGTNSATRLYWGRTYGAVWNNDGDCASLISSSGTLVNKRCF
jgi:micrococcal nuclease